jgi:hypothetical protein
MELDRKQRSGGRGVGLCAPIEEIMVDPQRRNSAVRAAVCAFALSVSAAASSYTVTVVAIPSGLTEVYVNSLNDSGQIAGDGRIGNNSLGFIGATPIPYPGGWTSLNVTGMNNLGQVTGYGGGSSQ